VGVRVYYRATDDFRLGNIQNPMPYHPEWEIPQLTSEEQKKLQNILSQKFSYIGKGSQTYAFASEDQQYVLKFFKFKHLRPSLLFGILPKLPLLGPYQEREILRKQRKLNSIFTGYKLAFDVDKEESGLIFIQLNPSQNPLYVTVVDKIGVNRTIDLGSVPYVIQEKGETLRSVLNRLIQNGDMEAAKQRIGQLLDLYVLEYHKGIYDRDHGVMCNTGFIEGRPFHLDVGKMVAEERMKQPEYFQPDLILVANKIEQWTKTNHPNEAPEIKQYLESRLSTIFGTMFQL